MSLIVGRYYRGDPKQKPKQWGTSATISSIIKNNAEQFLGVDGSIIKHVWPFWEGAGLFWEAISGAKSVSPPNTWNNEAASFYKSVSPYGVNSGVQQDLGDNFSIFLVMAPVLESAAFGAYLSAGSTASGEWMFRRSSDVYGSFQFYGNAGSVSVTANTGVNDDSIVPIIIDRDSIDLRIFINGKYMSRDESANANFNTTKQFQFGGADSNSSRAGSCDILFCCIFNNTLTKSFNDVCKGAYLSDNPYSLIQPITRRSYFIPSGEITIKTISDSGFCSDNISGISNQLSVIDIGSGIDGFYGMSAELYVSDAGVSSESVKPIAAISVNDTASAIDAITQILSYCSVVDSGSAADSIANILASVAVTDAGSGFDIITVLKELLKTVTDSCSCVDAISQITVSSSVSDSASGIDILSQVLADISVADNGSGADFLSLITDILKTISDAGTGVDSVSIQPVSVSVQDVGLALDLIGNIAAALTITDSATAAEIISTIKTKLVTVSDSAIGSDNQSISVSLTVSDTVTAIDTIKQIINSLSISDSGGGIESITKIDLDNTPTGHVRITITLKAPGISITSR